MRRVAAAVVGLLIIVLLFVGIKGCLSSRKDQAFRDYAGNVRALTDSSNAESKALFQALSTPPKTSSGASTDSLDVQNLVNTQRQDAEDLVKRAEGLDHPDELSSANNWIVQTMKFRAGALAQIADALPAALGDKNRKPSIDRIAGQMQALLTSDVIYLQRAIPALTSAYDDRGIDEQFSQVRFLPSDQILTWLDPKGVQSELDKVSGGATDQAATPGLHGTGVGAVTVAGTELTPDGVNRVSAGGDVSFEVQIENQGDADETNIPVTVTVSGGGGKDITVEQKLPRIAAGETATVPVPLGQPAPTDGVATVKIDVAPVPGEGTKDNNTAEYQVAFTK